MSECRNRYIDGSWKDDEQDEEGVHMLEDLGASGRTREAHPRGSKEKTCIQPSCKTKTVENLATSSHVEEKTKHTREYIHQLTTQQIDMDTTTSQYMSIVSCQVVP